MSERNNVIEGELIFKFMSYDTAIKVILNQELMFSNPKTFDDPFDFDLKLDIIFRLKMRFNTISCSRNCKKRNPSQIIVSLR